MEKDQCFACVICEFMTYSHINLEQHFRLRHDGRPPKSVFKQVSEPMRMIIKQADAVLFKSRLFVAKRPLANCIEKLAVLSKIKSESEREILQSSSKQVLELEFRNDANLEESKPCPMNLFKSFSVAETLIKRDPDEIEKEVPELLLAPSDVDGFISGHEELEVDIAGKPLLSLDDGLLSAERGNEEGNENAIEVGDGHGEAGAKRRERRSTSKSAGDQTQVWLVCPKDCNFVTPDSRPSYERVPLQASMNLQRHTQQDDFVAIQRNIIPPSSMSTEGCDNDMTLGSRLHRAASLRVKKEKRVKIVLPKVEQIISAKFSSLTPEAAKDLELLRALPVCRETWRLPVRKTPVGRAGKQNLTKPKQSMAIVERLPAGGQKSNTPSVDKKVPWKELDRIHKGTSSTASPVTVECDKQLLGPPDWLTDLKPGRRPPIARLHKGVEYGDGLLQECGDGLLQCPMNSPNGEGPFVCFQCGRRFKFNAHLQRHIQCRHTDLRPFSCMHCGLTFNRTDYLHRHILCLHSNKKPFGCTHCHRAFGLQHLLQKHMKTKHPEELDEMPSYLQNTTLSLKSKPSKQNTTLSLKSKPSKQNQCKDTACGKTPVNQSNLRRHVRMHHRVRSCIRNGQTGDSQLSLNLQEHMRIETGSGGKLFACVHCDKSYPCKGNLNRHILVKHTMDCPHSCLHCGRLFSNSIELQRHLKTHAGKQPVEYRVLPEGVKEVASTKTVSDITSKKICNQSKKSSKQNNTLRLKSEPSKQNQRKDTPCGKTPVNQSNLRRHVRMHHNRVRSCIRNGQTGDSQLSRNLQEHMRIETGSGGKLFACVHCDKSYPCKGNLNRHILVKHTMDCPHSCLHCGRLFSNSIELQRHLKTHAGKQPVEYRVLPEGVKEVASTKTVSDITSKKICNQSNKSSGPRILTTKGGVGDLSCSMCEYTCRYRSHLYVHMRKHTGERPYKCKECGKCFGNPTGLKQHMNRHLPENCFHCTFCGVGFKWRGNLHRHISAQHTNKRRLSST